MSAPQAGGFSLFPNPNTTTHTTHTTRSRSQSRPRVATPQEGSASTVEATPPRTGRRRNSSATREGRQRAVSNNPWQHALDARQPRPSVESAAGPSTAPVGTAPEDPVVETPYAQPVTDVPQRCETAFSEAKTLVRTSSQRSRASIAKPPLVYAPAGQSSLSQTGESSSEPAAVRSIFPRYNPEVSLDRQEYYPTQTSPTHIPQAAISRPLYSAPNVTAAAPSGPRSPPAAAGPAAQVISPAPTANSNRWPLPGPGQRHHEPTVIPPVSTTEELRGLWKVTNGWRASSLEGRTYCLQMASAPDAPTYSLSSSTGHPFYCLRIDPTSASAIVSLSRYDPNKPFNPASSSSSPSSSPTPNSPNPLGIGAGGRRSPNSPSPRASSSSARPDPNPVHTPATTHPKHAKNWSEVLATTLTPRTTTTSSSEESPDQTNGILADLWPCAAARLVADRANDATTVALAQQESARLVYDADSGSHFLVHPALAVPFCVTIERSPAYSRTEYTLEHLESPCHLARLTRDGTGKGWLEVDTGVAGKVESVYLVDVAVAALVLVAHGDEGHVMGKRGGGEVFGPPPTVVFGAPPGADGAEGGGSFVMGLGGRSSRSSGRSRREEKKRKKQEKRGKKRMEQFEMDLESQSSDLKTEEKDKVPGVLRALVKLVTVTFKCFVWCATLAFKALMAILSGLARCCGLGKL